MSGNNGEPRTLGEAHEVLRRVLPIRSTSAHDWLVYHQRAAQLYQLISKIDPDHHHEALYFAATEREDADAVAVEIRTSASQAELTSTDHRGA